ncbi:hypothetical protein OEZ86_009254 [Tetradesmus obliquus]|nr:hypothetical protein OEZ86_009254 [Tetradesmus obliquus]
MPGGSAASFESRIRCSLRKLPPNACHRLNSINLEQCGEIGGFHLELPELQRLFMEHVEVQDEAGFGSSLSACPKLEMMNCYKLWGLGGTLHELRLPECRELSFYRSDDLEGLKLWAPKLTELELRACYSLECVRIMEDSPGSPVTPLRVNLVNANIDPLSKRHLKQHPRIKAPGGKLITKERDDPRAMWGLGEDDDAGGLMHEGEEDPFGSGDEQDDEDEEEWETDEDADERELQQRDERRPGPDDEREHQANEQDEDEDEDDEEDEDEEELSPGEMLAAMMMSGMSPGMAAAHLVAAMQGEEVDDDSEGGDGGRGSPQCVIEEVD